MCLTMAGPRPVPAVWREGSWWTGEKGRDRRRNSPFPGKMQGRGGQGAGFPRLPGGPLRLLYRTGGGILLSHCYDLPSPCGGTAKGG